MSRILNQLVAVAVALTITGCSAKDAPSSNDSPHSDTVWIGHFTAMQTLERQASLARSIDDHDAAANYFHAAANHSQHVPSQAGMTNRAMEVLSHVKSDDIPSAKKALEKLADEGFRHPNMILTAPSMEDFVTRNDTQAAMNQIKNNAEQYRAKYADPNTSPLVFDDIERFWAAYDAAAKVESDKAKADIFLRDYIIPGSPGLIDFFRIKIESAEQLVKKIEATRGYYDGIRAKSLRAQSLTPDIRDGMHRLQSIYPEAYFPPATFVIGRLNSAGTAGPEGLLMGVEVLSWTEGVPLEGFSPGLQKLVMALDLDRLPMVVVHEQIHGMQNYGGEDTLLRSVLQEGTADFMAELAFPDAKPSSYVSFGRANEARIWQKFSNELVDGEYRDWLGNNGRQDMPDDWHPDVGYFVGARIARDYYDKAEDKQAAIHDLLNITDAFEILDASGYADRFSSE